MFYQNKITGIEPGHRVLDVGPGANPHPQADVLLEMTFDDPAEYARQFGHDEPLRTEKELVFYDGVTFPFPDASFDYVICSHVLEHVPDVEHFMSEVFRVGRRGYIEYPLAYYDLIYNIPAHVNFLKMRDGVLHHMKKDATHLNDFRPLQQLLHQSMSKGHTAMVDDLFDLFMEGFQWEQPFQIKQVVHLDQVKHLNYVLRPRQPAPLDSFGAKKLIQALLRVARRRLIPS